MTAPITMERLAELLDAYGAAPERWPDAEREAARFLLEQSGAARALWDDAAALDRLLDGAPAAPPSPLLTARILAAAPRRRWPPMLVAAVPLAAAAAVMLWITVRQEPDRHVASVTPLEVGAYTSPTDVLLDSYGVDVYATMPSFGCTDSVLGCPKMDSATSPSKQGRSSGGGHFA